MWRDLFVNNPATAFAVVALLFFVGIFASAVIWALSKKRTAHYARMANLPVDSDD